MYVVHMNDGSSTATIHLVGGCGVQGKPSTQTVNGLDMWSFPLSSLKEARGCALLARKEHTVVCQVCEQVPEFGA